MQKIFRFWHEMAEGRAKGPCALMLRALLLPLSLLYRIAVRLRNAAYNLGLFRARRLPCPVVSVGNIAAGGTGKSPLVRLLASELMKRGRRVAVISRGYGAPVQAKSRPLVVSEGGGPLTGTRRAGDEPVMLAGNLPGAIVIADPDRIRGGTAAVERFGADLVILDDGFQHRRIARNADIVLLDAERPFGNGSLLPAGLLREPKTAVARADIVVFTRCGREPSPEAARALAAAAPGVPFFTARHEPARLRNIPSGEIEELGRLRGKKVAVFSGIARPEGVARLVTLLGAECVLRRDFPDHHYFTREEMSLVVAEARRSGAEALVTTSKDAVRLPNLKSAPLPVYCLEIEMKIGEGNEKLIESVLDLIDMSHNLLPRNFKKYPRQ